MKTANRIASRATLILAPIAAVILFTGWVLISLVQKDAFDQELAADFALVRNATKVWTDGTLWHEIDPVLMPQFNGTTAFRVTDDQGGEAIEQSLQLDLEGTTLRASLPPTPNYVVSDGLMPDGRPARIATQIVRATWGWDTEDPEMRPTEEARSKQVAITVARDMTALTRTTQQLALGLGLLWALLVPGIWLSVRRAAATAVLAETLKLESSNPVTQEVTAEFAPLAARIRQLLTDVQVGREEERRFTADAAHELRTPIAELRTMTDVALAFPLEPEDTRKTLQDANAISVRLGTLVGALLGMSREESIRADLVRRDVDAAALLRAAIDALHIPATAQELSFNVNVPDEHLVQTDPALLRSILDNLVGNAVAHAPKSSLVAIDYSGGTNGFRLDVVNQAPDLVQDDLAKLFKPFWRKQGSRADRNHSGLGLSLAQSFASILELDLEAHLIGGHRLQMTLRSR